LGEFAIEARVTLLWQHNANPSYKLAPITVSMVVLNCCKGDRLPRYDDLARTAGRAESARAAGRQLADDGGAPQTARRIQEAGAPARRRPAADGGRSQHYCSSLDCGLPLVAFWLQKANAKC